MPEAYALTMAELESTDAELVAPRETLALIALAHIVGAHIAAAFLAGAVFGRVVDC